MCHRLNRAAFRFARFARAVTLLPHQNVLDLFCMRSLTWFTVFCAAAGYNLDAMMFTRQARSQDFFQGRALCRLIFDIKYVIKKLITFLYLRR